jgi:hypothetical protein
LQRQRRTSRGPFSVGDRDTGWWLRGARVAARQAGARVEHLLEADCLVQSTRRTLEDLRFGVQLASR